MGTGHSPHPRLHQRLAWLPAGTLQMSKYLLLPHQMPYSLFSLFNPKLPQPPQASLSRKDRRGQRRKRELPLPKERSDSVTAFPFLSAEDAANSPVLPFAESLHLASSALQHPAPFQPWAPHAFLLLGGRACPTAECRFPSDSL